MIDKVHIRGMHEMFGDSEFSELIALFEEEGRALVSDLSDRFGSDLADALHALRGSAENMGLRGLSSLCRAAETQIAAGQSADTEEIGPAFETGLRDLRDCVGAS